VTDGATAYILGDNVSTDQLHPPDYFSLDPERMKKGFLLGVSRRWAECVPPGSIIVAGENFGCGSSREVTAQVFKERGIRLVLARSFARIFFRNLVNLGVPACTLESPPPWPPGTEVEVTLDMERHVITAADYELRFSPLSPLALRIIEAGGLLGLLEDRNR
jgi:3-isopropylmalate dehydratase small subunit